MVTETFKALGDPTRLKIVQRLSSGTYATINSVSTDLGITRQGARKHLDVLVGAKLVALEPQGRDVRVTLNPRSLTKAKAFIAQLEKQWDTRLAALKDFVENKENASNRKIK
jgi:DNA-binding transcriptional ArsR family regulator